MTEPIFDHDRLDVDQPATLTHLDPSAVPVPGPGLDRERRVAEREYETPQRKNQGDAPEWHWHPFRRCESFAATAVILGVLCLLVLTAATLRAEEPAPVEVKIFDTGAPGWRQLTGDDFVRVNGDDQTLVWSGGVAQGSGTPIGVTRTKTSVQNFELVVEWMHQKSAGNSGVFAWVPIEVLSALQPGELPTTGIEVQMLDHGYTEQAAAAGRPTDWFTSNGDIFPVQNSSMKPFPPLSPNGNRSFPSAETTNGFGQWNQYYIRGINGEIRLWVNGTEVSGGCDCNPAAGHLCLESEGSPIQFRNIYLRELP